MEEQIIEKDGKKYKVIELIDDNKNKVIINGWDLTEYEQWYDNDYCLKAVKNNGDSLQYVKEQTPEICLKAVENNGDSLRYVNKKIFTKVKKCH